MSQAVFKETVQPEFIVYTDDGVEIQQVLHTLRSIAMKNFNERFKSTFNGYGQVSTKGLIPTQRLVLGALFVYQLAL